MNDSNKDSSTVATGESDTLDLVDALEAMQPAFAADRDKLARAAEALRRLHATAIPKEPMTRFCPGCGSVGEVDRKKFRDCCPDGVRARVIPAKLAEKCHDLFQVALQAASQPEVEQGNAPDHDYREACALATALFKKHFATMPEYASGEVTWSVCDTTEGVISQIGNMVSGLVQPTAIDATPEPAAP